MHEKTWPKATICTMRPALTIASAAVVAFASISIASAQLLPNYFNTYHDAVTGNNAFWHQGSRYWFVTPGSDSYQNDFYERPTAQTYKVNNGIFSAEEYLEYIDITTAHVGYDNQYLYVKIDMFGVNKSTKDGVDTKVGLDARYGFRIGGDADGRNSMLFVVDQPSKANNPNTVFSPLKTFGYKDTDGDVGGRGIVNGGATGLSVTKTDNPKEEQGMNGYESQIISDGKLQSGQTVLYSRLDPNNEASVEMALDYVALGITEADLLSTKYLEFEAIKGGPKDPQNYLWNDKYTNIEAGSPNPGAGGLSEFGTQGLGNIYELDTLRGAAIVPEPATMITLGLGGLAVALRRRKNNATQ